MLAQSEKVHALSRCRMAKSSKHSRSKGNSLPPTKRFDFTMVNDNINDLQHGFVPKKRTHIRRNVWSSSKTGPAQGIITAAQPLKGCQTTLSLLTPRCNSSKSSIMVKSNHLASGRLLSWPFYVDSLLGTNCKSTNHNLRFNHSNYPHIFRAAIFAKPLTTHFQSGIAYFTAWDLRVQSTWGSHAVNAIRHWKRVVTTTHVLSHK